MVDVTPTQLFMVLYGRSNRMQSVYLDKLHCLQHLVSPSRMRGTDSPLPPYSINNFVVLVYSVIENEYY